MVVFVLLSDSKVCQCTMTKSLLFLLPFFILRPRAALCKAYSRAFGIQQCWSTVLYSNNSFIFLEAIQIPCRLLVVNAVGLCKCLYELGKEDLVPSFQRRVLIHEVIFEMPLLSNGR